MTDIASFCAKNGLCPDIDTIRAGTERFLAEMEGGLAGKGSLKSIPAYIDPYAVTGLSGKVIAIDAGGTNLRIALLSFSGGANPDIEYFEKYPVPGAKEAITAGMFFDRLAEYLEPVAGKADKIGFCFSFPARVLPNRDAEIIRFTKEVRVSGSEGRLLGEGLREALRARGLPHNASIAVVNDTVAALLAGMAGTKGQTYGGFAGIILGTGTNTAYIEKNANIKKEPALSKKAGHTVINLESAAYALNPRSPVDDWFDARTELPGTQLHEKMIGGTYTGGLFLAFLKAAAEEGCFPAAPAARIRETVSLTGKQIDAFCDDPQGGNALALIAGDCRLTRAALQTLAGAFFDRVAALVTVNLAAIILKTGAGANPLEPVCITAEGTAFYKARLFRPRLDAFMERYVRRELGRHYAFVNIENSTLLGTAAAGLLGGRDGRKAL